MLRTLNESAGIFPLHPSNFMPAVNAELCLECGQCAESCHVHAITQEAGGPPAINSDLCVGCGVCAGACPAEALSMERRAVLHVPPQTKKEQMTLIAVERNRF